MDKKNFRVLLIEDDSGDSDLVNEVIGESGYPISLEVIDDGVKAVTYLTRYAGNKNVKPDLILLDLNLPRKDGREVLKEIKSHRELKTIPVVVLTTSDAQSDIANAYELGCNSYITKPVGFKDFSRAVNSIIDYWLNINLPP